jgi:hypothetical protein
MIDELNHRAFTAGEFAAIEQPPCPVCGTPVEIERLDVTMNAEDERLNGRSCIAGMWSCPRDCDPRTGERRHYSQQFAAGPDGMSFECSCGVKGEFLTGPELAAMLEQHKAPSP